MIRWQRGAKQIGSPKTLCKLVITKDFKPKLWVLDVKYKTTAPTEKHLNSSPLTLKVDLLCLPSCSPIDSHKGITMTSQSCWLNFYSTSRYWLTKVLCWIWGTQGILRHHSCTPGAHSLAQKAKEWGSKPYMKISATGNYVQGTEAGQMKDWWTVYGGWGESMRKLHRRGARLAKMQVQVDTFWKEGLVHGPSWKTNVGISEV